VRYRFLTLEKTIRTIVEDMLAANSNCAPGGITANVVLLSDFAADIHAAVRNEGGSPLLPSLARNIASEIAAKTGYRSKIMIEVIPCQAFSTLQPEDAVATSLSWKGGSCMAVSKRILVLTADAGLGHRSAASAVALALHVVETPVFDVRLRKG
jgi:hypothetical protein